MNIAFRRAFSSLRLPPAGVALLALPGLLAAPALAQRSTPLQLLHPAGAAGDRFGAAVAIDGDTMIVGASNDGVGPNLAQGSVHIYRWTGDAWALEASLTAADGAANDQFGTAVAISGDTLVVGAFGVNFGSGAAYVFTRAGGVWTQQARLVGAGGTAGNNFGFSVGVDGNIAAIGAPQETIGGRANQGAMYIFRRNGTSWSQQARVTSLDGLAGDFVGYSVGVSGETIVAGAYGDDNGANGNQGAAYIFTRTGGVWDQQAKLTASDGAANDFFGYSVSIDQDTVAVGAFGGDVLGAVNQGAGYVFARSGTTWSQQAKLTALDGLANDNLGISVSASGESVLLGAYRDDTGLTNDRGSAYVYRRVGGSWSQQAKLEAPDGLTSDFFGNAVALCQDTAVIGATGDDVSGNSDQGSAWVFSRFETAWIGPDLKALASDGATNDNLGCAVAMDGDTAIVGAYTDTINSSASQGSAYIFVRTGHTWIQQAKLVASDGASGDLFGLCVDISGDYAIVGAPLDDIGVTVDVGSAYVFVRSGSTWTQQAKLTSPNGAANDAFGGSVAISGGTALVGADDHAVSGNSQQGTAYVFVRSGTSWSVQTTLTSADGAASDHFGASVALDRNTAVVGANGANAAYIFVRSGTLWQQQAKLVSSDVDTFDSFGTSASVSGDTALVGAPGDNAGNGSNQGSAYVFVRARGDLVTAGQAHRE